MIGAIRACISLVRLHRLALPATVALWTAAASLLAQPVPPPPTPALSESLLDLSRTVQAVTDDNFLLELHLDQLIPREQAVAANLVAFVARIKGQWRSGEGEARDFNTARHRIDPSGLTIEGDALRGTLIVTLRPDRWIPTDRREQRLEIQIDGRLSTPEPRTDGSDDGSIRNVVSSGKFWDVLAESQADVRTLDGRFTTQFQGKPVTGSVRGSMSAPVRSGYWNMGRWDTQTPGVRIDLNLGSRRQSWNHSRLAVLQLSKGRDLRKYAGLRLTLATDKPRADVSVSVWLREQDGSWYYRRSAVPLTLSENTAEVRFADFAEAEFVAPSPHMDEDFALDLSAVSHLGVGIVNPLGVGQVSFVIKSIDLIPAEESPPPPANLTVTGQTLSVNGHDRVPPGIFGGSATFLDPSFRPGSQRILHYLPGGGPSHDLRRARELFIIDCWGDRYHRPPQLADGPDWPTAYARMAQRFALAARAANYPAVLEIWNEPYRNWTLGDRLVYGTNWYDLDRAGENSPVIAKSTGQVMAHLRWRRAKDEQWEVYDPSQYSYWPGKAVADLYNQIVEAIAPAMKAANPQVQTLVGWGLPYHTDHWAVWNTLYRPTIDRHIASIDGVTEHHFGGDPTAMPGSYEVLTAYAMTRHGKWLYSFCTDTNDLAEVPLNGIARNPELAQRLGDHRRAVYHLRDILGAVLQSPDKLRARTAFMPADRDGKPQPWTAIVYDMLANLRGRLIQTQSSDPSVWCVASVDGSDPASNIAGQGDSHALVVVVFNDHREPRECRLNLQSPSGTRFTSATIRAMRLDPATCGMSIDLQSANVTGESHRLDLTLPGRSAWSITLPLDRPIAPGTQLQRRQFFSPDMLHAVRASQPATFSLDIDPTELDHASQAILRLVVQDLDASEGIVEINGHALPLPKAVTADNVLRIVELPIDKAALSSATQLRFTVRDPSHDGYRVEMASVVLETPSR